MKRGRALYSMLAWLAVGGMCFPVGALAERPKPAIDAASSNAWRTVDVELRPGGVFVGQLVNTSAQPLAGAVVSIRADDTLIVSTRTDQNGLFAVRGLRGGVHQIEAGQSWQLCRLWAPGTAPPSAIPALRLDDGANLVRGQWGPPAGNQYVKLAKVWATNPFVIGGIVAAAVAIPVAVKNADEDSNS